MPSTPRPYLTEVHDISFDALVPDPALAARIRALPGRRIVYTNGSRALCRTVLRARGLDGLFDAVYGVEHAGFRPKPERAAFETIFTTRRPRSRRRAAMFEDDPRNLAAPHAMGMRTVHVAPEARPAPHIHHHTDDLSGLSRAARVTRTPLGQLPRAAARALMPRTEAPDAAPAHRYPDLWRRRRRALTAAAAFGAAGFQVLCVDPAPPVTDRTPTRRRPAHHCLSAALGRGAATPRASGTGSRPTPRRLQIMRIVDAGGDTPEPRIVKDFDAADISDQPFGWNLPNWLLRREMVARLTELPNVDFRPGTGHDVRC